MSVLNEGPSARTSRPVKAVDPDDRYPLGCGAITALPRDTGGRIEAAPANPSDVRIADLLHGLDVIIWEADAESFEFTFVSQGAEKLLGYPVAQWLSETHFWDKLFHPEDRHHARSECLAAGESTEPYEFHHRAVTADGRTVWLRNQVRLVRDHVHRPSRLRGVMLDITRSRQSEEALRGATKMEAVGRLAGGVAHDFNNMLAVITGYTELLLDAAEPNSPASDYLHEVRNASERAAGLTRQLLAFSRKQVLSTEPVSLGCLVERMVPALRAILGHRVEVVLKLDPEAGAVRADPAQLELILTNLTTNARDAMPDGGTLRLEIIEEHIDGRLSQGKFVVEPGRYVALRVSDTGCGMDPETREQIFEPFFTTKGVGKGTGLGLSTAYGIVKQSLGYICCDSHPGSGAAFTVYLPRHSDAAVESVDSSAASGTLTGTEIVLLVEDEPMVRGLARSVLENHGYTVLQAAGGAEAISLLDRHSGPVDLLLTDVSMPGMDGRELAERVLAMRPGIHVLFMSGYTEEAIRRNGVLEPGTSFLAKPFTPSALARKIRSVLSIS